MQALLARASQSHIVQTFAATSQALLARISHVTPPSTEVSSQWWLTSPNRLACDRRHSTTIVSICEQQHTIVCAVSLDPGAILSATVKHTSANSRVRSRAPSNLFGTTWTMIGTSMPSVLSTLGRLLCNRERLTSFSISSSRTGATMESEVEVRQDHSQPVVRESLA